MFIAPDPISNSLPKHKDFTATLWPLSWANDQLRSARSLPLEGSHEARVGPAPGTIGLDEGIGHLTK